MTDFVWGVALSSRPWLSEGQQAERGCRGLYENLGEPRKSTFGFNAPRQTGYGIGPEIGSEPIPYHRRKPSHEAFNHAANRKANDNDQRPTILTSSTSLSYVPPAPLSKDLPASGPGGPKGEPRKTGMSLTKKGSGDYLDQD